MAATHRFPANIIVILFLCLAIIGNTHASSWVGIHNKAYDGRNPLFGVVQQHNPDCVSSSSLAATAAQEDVSHSYEHQHHEHHEQDYHASLDDMESVPDGLLIFYALARWFP